MPKLFGISALAPSQKSNMSAPSPAVGSSLQKDAVSCCPLIAQTGRCSSDTFLCLSGATAAGGNACFLCHIGRRAPSSAKIWKIASFAMMLRRRPSVWSYCIRRDGWTSGKWWETLGPQFWKVSAVNEIAFPLPALPKPGFRQSRAVLAAGGTHTYML